MLLEDERIDDLEYKNLKIIQNKKGFCFGIDSVLLSDYAKNIRNDSTVIDIGTGTGIIALLLAKKTKLKKIYGIEIQEEVANMAKRSVDLNGLSDKIEIINEDINNIFGILEKNKYDAIVTNPPYKKAETGIKSIDRKQLISRHEVKCTLEDIIEKSSKLLKDKGEFYMVHRAERLVDIISTMRKAKIEPKQLRMICSSKGKEPKLVLIKGIKNAKPFLKIQNNLYIYNKDGKYTPEILKIYAKKDE